MDTPTIKMNYYNMSNKKLICIIELQARMIGFLEGAINTFNISDTFLNHYNKSYIEKLKEIYEKDI